jgi:hypothetical protein
MDAWHAPVPARLRLSSANRQVRYANNCIVPVSFRQIPGVPSLYRGPMEETLRMLRGEADLCRRLAAAIIDPEVIRMLLAAAEEAESRISRLSLDRSAELTVH